jgi:tellurite resistance protein TerC
VGSWLLAEFHWILYVFGALLVLTGIKMCLIDVYKIPVSVSLAVVLGILGLTMFLSMKTAKSHART